MLTNRIGQVYGRLTVIERTVCPKRFASEAYRDHTWWRCLCECGGEKIAAGPNLTAGYVKSCGCLKREHGLRTIVGLHLQRGWRPWTADEEAALREAKARKDSEVVIAERLQRTVKMVACKWMRMQAEQSISPAGWTRSASA